MRRVSPSGPSPEKMGDPLDPQSGYYQPAARQPEGGDYPEFIPSDPLYGEDMPPESAARVPQHRRRGKKRIWKSVACFLIAAGILFALLNSMLFKIRSVRVEGNRTRSASDIVAMSGLDKGVNFFSVKREDLERGLSADRYLQLTGFEKRFPSSVTLYVRERALCANVQFNSIWYLMDEEGFVLEKLSQEQPRNTLPRVTGIQVRDARVGASLVPGREEQLASYRLVMAELLRQGYVNETEEINVGDSEHITLLTRDSFTVDLGWADQDLMAKIAVVRGVAGKLRELEKTGGVLDVTDLNKVIYSP